MSLKASELVVESFVNSIGQTINPGDKVVAVTTGYGHRVSIITGIFDGVRRALPNNKIVGSRLSQVPVTWKERVYAEDGEFEETKYDWNTYKSVTTGKRYNLVPKVSYRKSSLQLNRVFKVDTPLTEVSI